MSRLRISTSRRLTAAKLQAHSESGGCQLFAQCRDANWVSGVHPRVASVRPRGTKVSDRPPLLLPEFGVPASSVKRSLTDPSSRIPAGTTSLSAFDLTFADAPRQASGRRGQEAFHAALPSRLAVGSQPSS